MGSGNHQSYLPRYIMADTKNNAARARRPHADDGTQPPTAKKRRTGEQRLSLQPALSAPDSRASRSREKATEVPSNNAERTQIMREYLLQGHAPDRERLELFKPTSVTNRCSQPALRR